MTEVNYYGNLNNELLRWIPLTAKRVLELGCGEGTLAAAYRRRNPTVEYVAIEANGPAAAVARARVDRLIEADFTAMDAGELDALGRFDAVVLGDVLEHLPDPWAALKTLSGLLTEDGRLALSVPNVSHWTAMANLLSGVWPAEDSGLFDRTHVRFFTLHSLKTILQDSGLALERARPRPSFDDPAVAERLITILADAAEKAGQDRTAFVQRARAIQYVVNARRTVVAAPPSLHVHFAALAPDFLDARTRLPFLALDSEPTLTMSYQERSATLPPMAPKAPKIAVLQRLLMKDGAVWRAFVDRARFQGWILVYEIDDHPALIGRVHQGAVDDQMHHIVSEGCHAVQTSTPALAEVFRALNPEVAVFPNAVIDLPPFLPRATAGRVFYGALNREGFSAQVGAALGPAIEAAPDLEFVVVHDRAFFDALATDRKTFHPIQPYAKYLELMASCDIVLSPLEGAFGETFKSDIKFVEAARCGAAMIASPCVYEAAIQDGETGLLARTMADWASHLTLLAADPEARNRIAEAAWRQVRDRRMMCGQVAPRRDWYRSLYERRAELDRALGLRLAAMPLS